MNLTNMASKDPEKRQSASPEVLIIGVGLIGGSLAGALKRSGAYHVSVYDTHHEASAMAVEQQLAHRACDNLAQGVAAADVIVLTVPVLGFVSVLKQLAQWNLGAKIITDAGSVKQCFLNAVTEAFGYMPKTCVPAHPIAGSEHSGVQAANPDLYRHHNVIITPVAQTDSHAVQSVKAMWEATGAVVECMDVRQHDNILAMTSHLPHLLAFALVDTLSYETQKTDIFRYSAGGLRDFTRIAGSDPQVWHDIFSANQNALLPALERFITRLERLKGAISDADQDQVLSILHGAQSAQMRLSQMLKKRMNTPIQKPYNSFTGTKAQKISGDIRVPGDKSISHRAVMLASLAQGTSHIRGLLLGEDVLSTLQAFQDMGVVVQWNHDKTILSIKGVGLHGLQVPTVPLDMGNSGTAMRLLSGVLSGQRFDSTLVGDASLSVRPMRRIAEPLALMGAVVDTCEGKPPLRIQGGADLYGITYTLPVASAQIKSCVLLAALYAKGTTCVIEPSPTRDHTEHMLTTFGYKVSRQNNRISVQGGEQLQATDIEVPADISSAAFFMVAASIVEGSELTLRGVGMNPTRTGVIEILCLMGADIHRFNERMIGSEAIADLKIRAAALSGIDIPESLVASAIDEFPVIFIAAACAKGRTRLTGAEELRVKESDRIQCMADGLSTLGVMAIATADGMEIEGGPIGGGVIESFGDHRIAMAFAVASLRADAPVVIRECAPIATSFPGFFELAQTVGFQLVKS